jgi:3-deoxy-7-phosphoheptulonate synthase
LILVLETGIGAEQKAHICRLLKRDGWSFAEVSGGAAPMFEVLGKPGQDQSRLRELPGVAKVLAPAEPLKLAGRETHPRDTVVRVGDVAIGGDRLVVIAGPCSVESREQALTIAEEVKRFGAVLFRGGAYKPRSSPYAFQGLGEDGLKILAEVRDKTGLRTVSEIVSADRAEIMLPYVDVLQIGARNMQNYELLKCVGKLDRPVLLKRGLAATIEEWLMSAEYILAEGNPNVILCERGIRTFEPYTRNTLDLSAIPVVKRLTHLPILVDPSHATGIREKVAPMARAAVAAGADGLTIEVHDEPEKALSDGAQSLLPEQFGQLMRDLYTIAPVVGKQMDLGYLDKAESVRRSQRRPADGMLRVVFPGESGTFSHKACTQYFGNDMIAVPMASSREVFCAVAHGGARFGVVPLENSLSGSVHENYDLLLEYDLRIVGEVMLRIQYCLIAHPLTRIDQIARVRSHPDVLRQCQQFLTAQGWEQLSTTDEAAAVRLLKERGDATEAAIAGRDAAEICGMHVIEAGIETNPRNYTRFGVIGSRPLTAGPYRKTSLIYETGNRPGALYKTLGLFAAKGINLVKLESRPLHGKPWEYMFYVDVEADLESEALRPVLDTLRELADNVRVLGCYS